MESTIGNPTYVASYLTLISFISIGLVLREFQINFKQSYRNTYLNFELNSKIFIIISIILVEHMEVKRKYSGLTLRHETTTFRIAAPKMLPLIQVAVHHTK